MAEEFTQAALEKQHCEELGDQHAVACGQIEMDQNPRSQFLAWEDVKGGLGQYLDWYRTDCVEKMKKMNHEELISLNSINDYRAALVRMAR